MCKLDPKNTKLVNDYRNYESLKNVIKNVENFCGQITVNTISTGGKLLWIFFQNKINKNKKKKNDNTDFIKFEIKKSFVPQEIAYNFN